MYSGKNMDNDESINQINDKDKARHSTRYYNDPEINKLNDLSIPNYVINYDPVPEPILHPPEKLSTEKMLEQISVFSLKAETNYRYMLVKDIAKNDGNYLYYDNLFNELITELDNIPCTEIDSVRDKRRKALVKIHYYINELNSYSKNNVLSHNKATESLNNFQELDQISLPVDNGDFYENNKVSIPNQDSGSLDLKNVPQPNEDKKNFVEKTDNSQNESQMSPMCLTNLDFNQLTSLQKPKLDPHDTNTMSDYNKDNSSALKSDGLPQKHNSSFYCFNKDEDCDSVRSCTSQSFSDLEIEDSKSLTKKYVLKRKDKNSDDFKKIQQNYEIPSDATIKSSFYCCTENDHCDSGRNCTNKSLPDAEIIKEKLPTDGSERIQTILSDVEANYREMLKKRIVKNDCNFKHYEKFFLEKLTNIVLVSNEQGVESKPNEIKVEKYIKYLRSDDFEKMQKKHEMPSGNKKNGKNSIYYPTDPNTMQAIENFKRAIKSFAKNKAIFKPFVFGENKIILNNKEEIKYEEIEDTFLHIVIKNLEKSTTIKTYIRNFNKKSK